MQRWLNLIGVAGVPPWIGILNVSNDDFLVSHNPELQAGTFNEHTAALLFKQIMPGPTADSRPLSPWIANVWHVQPLQLFLYTLHVFLLSFFTSAIQSIQTFWNRGRFWHFLEEVSVSFPCLLWTLACGAPRSAVSYIHMNMICHRDLKPENFLISKKCAIQVGPALFHFRMGMALGWWKHGETWWNCLPDLPDLPGWEGETHRLWNCEALWSGPLDHQGLVTPDLWWLGYRRSQTGLHGPLRGTGGVEEEWNPQFVFVERASLQSLWPVTCCCFRELDWIQ